MTEDTDTTEEQEEQWHEYVEEELYKAEEHIERALHACENQQMRGALMGTYRDLVGTIFRYYDNVEFDTDLTEGEETNGLDRLREKAQEQVSEYQGVMNDRQRQKFLEKYGDEIYEYLDEEFLNSEEDYMVATGRLEDKYWNDEECDECDSKPDDTGLYNASTVTGDSHTFSSIKDTVDELIHSSVNKEKKDE